MDDSYLNVTPTYFSNVFNAPVLVRDGGSYDARTSFKFSFSTASELCSFSPCKSKGNQGASGKPYNDKSSLDLGLGCIPFLSETNANSGTTELLEMNGNSTSACVQMAKEIKPSSCIHSELDVGLHLGNRLAHAKLGMEEHKLDLDLGLSLGTVGSDTTTVTIGSSISSSKIPLHGQNSTGTPLSNCELAKVAMQVSSSTTSSMMHQQHRSANMRRCEIMGCERGARGASGRCIAHGGGRRCQKPGCHKGAEGRTVFCKAHGGGRRCQHLGCTKSAEGCTDWCIAHGGGRRCRHESCARAARGKSGLCIRHGGGKRCSVENCTKSAEGVSGLCISHGGGRRCQHSGCTKGAQGSTMFCKAHGGGKRCNALGCPKGAEGSTPYCKAHGGGKRCTFQGGGVCPRSVHGGTLFCVSHGGGKRCAVRECTKSARGRTAYCVRHGGGKRCQYEGCGKSAQGRTDFCKAHGGGKRCMWSELTEQNYSPCDKFARGKTGLCMSHSSQAQGLQANNSLEKMDDCHDPSVPFEFSLPEGRVHGGRLMEMLARNINGSDWVI